MRRLPGSDGTTGAPPPGLDPVELADDLDGMAGVLQEVDPRAAERLGDLARSIVTEEGRARWSDVDLRRAFNTERLANAFAIRREGGYASASIEVATRVRDVMILVPLLLTWLAFWEASQAYEEFVSADVQNRVGLPFIYIWQRGFDGHGSIFASSFSTVALIDAALIATIILLTFYSQGRREQREDDIARTASRFQTDLDNVLGTATVALASDRSNRPAVLARGIERLADRFDRGSRELLDQLRSQQDRMETITSRREQEFADFGVFASGMRAGAEESHRMLQELRSVSHGLTNALEDLTSEVSVSGDQQRTLLAAVGNLEHLVATSVQSDQAVARQLAAAAEGLSDAADRAMSGSEAAAQAGRVASEAVRGIAELAADLTRGQARVELAIADGVEANSRLADALRGSTGGVAASTELLTDIGVGLAQLNVAFAHISDQSTSQTDALTSLLREQQDVAVNLGQVARDLSAVGIATAQRQREVSEELSDLLHQLTDLTSQLSRTSGGAISPGGGGSFSSGNARPAAPRPSAPVEPAWPVAPPEAPSRPDQPGERPALWPRKQRRPGTDTS